VADSLEPADLPDYPGAWSCITDEPSGWEVDALVTMFAKCNTAGVEIPADMPLDTLAHRRQAVHFLDVLLRTGGTEPRKMT